MNGVEASRGGGIVVKAGGVHWGDHRNLLSWASLGGSNLVQVAQAGGDSLMGSVNSPRLLQEAGQQREGLRTASGGEILFRRFARTGKGKKNVGVEDARWPKKSSDARDCEKTGAGFPKASGGRPKRQTWSIVKDCHKAAGKRGVRIREDRQKKVAS